MRAVSYDIFALLRTARCVRLPNRRKSGVIDLLANIPVGVKTAFLFGSDKVAAATGQEIANAAA